jgi:hypothetical protein
VSDGCPRPAIARASCPTYQASSSTIELRAHKPGNIQASTAFGDDPEAGDLQNRDLRAGRRHRRARCRMPRA